MSFKYFFSQDYFFSVVTNGRFNLVYLVAASLLLVLPVFIKVYLRRKKRAKAIARLDRYWLFGSWAFGVVGLFIYFSRTQGLKIFSTRAFSYLWLILMAAYTVFVYLYIKRELPKRVQNFYEKERKKKYLKRKRVS